VVPVVPVCTYAHVSEGRHVFAERVKKKTGTNWDRDQPGARRQDSAPGASVLHQSGCRASRNNAPAAFQSRSSPTVAGPLRCDPVGSNWTAALASGDAQWEAS
jgi:hypothetical protein